MFCESQNMGVPMYPLQEMLICYAAAWGSVQNKVFHPCSGTHGRLI